MKKSLLTQSRHLNDQIGIVKETFFCYGLLLKFCQLLSLYFLVLDVNTDEGDGKLPINKGEDFVLSALGELQHHLRRKQNNQPYLLEKFFSFSYRLATFEKWSDTHSLRPMHLAQAGFCYTGIGEACICPWCEIIIDKWGYFDEPFGKHKETSSSVCTYLHYLFPTKLIEPSDLSEPSQLIVDESC